MRFKKREMEVASFSRVSSPRSSLVRIPTPIRDALHSVGRERRGMGGEDRRGEEGGGEEGKGEERKEEDENASLTPYHSVSYVPSKNSWG